MITRLQVDGFKNLIGVDVRFGPFTCIAGANGVGKSNLFDAISFLSRLADSTLNEAASQVRDPEGRSGNLRALFTLSGEERSEVMKFGVEMLVPREATDDLNQPAKASITLLRYDLHLGFEEGDQVTQPDRLVIRHESLNPISGANASVKQALPFLVKQWKGSGEWRKGTIVGRRTSAFISTASDEGHIRQHPGTRGGRPILYDMASLPRTILSTSDAPTSPTGLVARREMQSWSLLHFEPSALRSPDDFRAPSRLAPNGAYLPSTLYRLAHKSDRSPSDVYAQVANRLAELIEDVRLVQVDRDEKRELLTLVVRDRSGSSHSARSLSDGTLRFLALAVLQEDPEARGVWCLEEPENGLYPARIPAMMRLLKEIAVDTSSPVDVDNPLRQVIINTHSPGVVREVPEDSLVAAIPAKVKRRGQMVQTVRFQALDETWRTSQAEPPAEAIQRPFLLDYLNRLSIAPSGDGAPAGVEMRVIDRPDVQHLAQLALDL